MRKAILVLTLLLVLPSSFGQNSKCKTNQLRVKTVIEYDKTGRVLETSNHDNDPWEDVAPRTAGEVMLRTVCRRPWLLSNPRLESGAVLAAT